MIKARIAQFLSQRKRIAPMLPEGLRLYAIGDVHGRLDLLLRLAEYIEADAQSAPGRSIAIFLGDYIDRGPNSSGVVEFLSSGAFPIPMRALRGNHEETALEFLRDPAVLDDWRRYGGLETLCSYGVEVSEVLRGLGYERAQHGFIARLPERHRAFLEETEFSAVYGDYFFCHAGVRPGTPLTAQKPEDLLWIRDEFLRHAGAWEKFIVHGHTPRDEPEIRDNRINVDTGAFATSKLTALVLEKTERRFLCATP